MKEEADQTWNKNLYSQNNIYTAGDKVLCSSLKCVYTQRSTKVFFQTLE